MLVIPLWLAPNFLFSGLFPRFSPFSFLIGSSLYSTRIGAISYHVIQNDGGSLRSAKIQKRYWIDQTACK